jgi:hypothetical protein
LRVPLPFYSACMLLTHMSQSCLLSLLSLHTKPFPSQFQSPHLRQSLLHQLSFFTPLYLHPWTALLLKLLLLSRQNNHLSKWKPYFLRYTQEYTWKFKSKCYHLTKLFPELGTSGSCL